MKLKKRLLEESEVSNKERLATSQSLVSQKSLNQLINVRLSTSTSEVCFQIWCLLNLEAKATQSAEQKGKYLDNRGFDL